jgi:hypothetical protein
MIVAVEFLSSALRQAAAVGSNGYGHMLPTSVWRKAGCGKLFSFWRAAELWNMIVAVEFLSSALRQAAAVVRHSIATC